MQPGPGVADTISPLPQQGRYLSERECTPVMTPSAESTDASTPQGKKLRRLLSQTLKVGVAALVVWALGRHVVALIMEWSGQETSLRGLSLNFGWIGVAVTTFLCGQLCFAAFWGRLLKCCGVIASPMETLRAYCVGTLGKYVPGKALVVLVRTGLLPGGPVSSLSVGLTVVYETLTMMAVGGAVASVCLLIVQPEQWLFWSGAAATACGLTACLHPALFGRLAKFAALPFKEARNDFSAKACCATFWRWSMLPAGGWVLLGASSWGVARAIGIECSSADDFLFLTGTAAMATAVGFLVLFMPAGLGVRELVIIHLLAPRYGLSEVVLASLLLRTIWTLAEVLLGGVLYGVPPLLGKLFGTAVTEPPSKAMANKDATPKLLTSRAKPVTTIAIVNNPPVRAVEVQLPTVPYGQQDSVEDAARC